MRRTTAAVLMGAGLLAGAAALAWWWQPVEVTTALVTRGTAVDAVYATGVIEPTVMVPVAPRTGARLTALEVDEGAAVRQGQVLARLESDDLQQTVDEMTARERLARLQYERTQTLVRQQFLSPAELDRTRTELQAAQAALQRSRTQRDYSQLLAPADGLVLRRDGERGQFIPAGQAVYTLACCAPLRVAVEVDEEDIARVRPGQPVVMRTEALPDRLFDGQVGEITPKGDAVSRSYRVRITLKEAPPVSDQTVRSGMTMDANIVTGQRDRALLMPSQALGGAVVWRLHEGTLQRVPVKVGAAGVERTEVLAGLEEGDEVVVSPAAGLREGQRARAREVAVAGSAPAAASASPSAPSPAPSAAAASAASGG
ncbi:efflux RND transporter periplasmic adaptor subunit [Sphaerotilus hippei]|nr:efflux RND transporter periplasmic adaptor subunit [Sphaerotilus hippei]